MNATTLADITVTCARCGRKTQHNFITYDKRGRAAAIRLVPPRWIYRVNRKTLMYEAICPACQERGPQ